MCDAVNNSQEERDSKEESKKKAGNTDDAKTVSDNTNNNEEEAVQNNNLPPINSNAESQLIINLEGDNGAIGKDDAKVAVQAIAEHPQVIGEATTTKAKGSL